MKSILLIEDNALDAILMKATLRELGYNDITCVSNLLQARQTMAAKQPSLIIADIFLDNELGTAILTEELTNSIPIIFTTASKNIETYKRIENNYRYGYLIKPIDPINLYALINQTKLQLITSKNTTLFIRKGKKQYKINFSDIMWLEAEGNYTFIHTRSEKYVVKKSLIRFMQELDDRFVQSHKKFYVNLSFVSGFKRDLVLIDDKEVPLTYFFKKAFLQRLQLLDSQ
jgi:DNA-binding LytR/AlgR family response regulator